MESYVLSEGYIAFCTPEFNFFYFFVQESIQRGSVVGVSAEECISFSIYIGSSYAEGADFRIVLFAIAKACSPEVRITFGIGVLIVVAEYVEAAPQMLTLLVLVPLT